MTKIAGFYSMNSSFRLIIIILFGIGLVRTASVCFAQINPWTTKTDMNIPRTSLGVCEVNGKIYAIGGGDTGTGLYEPGSQAIEEYDPVSDKWTVKENMPTGRNDISVAVVNGKIYAIGGFRYIQGTGQVGLATVEVYDPASNTWETKTSMPTARSGVATSVFNGKIYAIGGNLVPAWQRTNKVEVYDTLSNSWETLSDMPMPPRGYITASLVNDKIYVIGGVSDGGIAWSLNQEYDPALDVWSAKSSMPHARTHAAAEIINGKIYIIGGARYIGGPGTSTVQEYDPAADSWILRSLMPTGRRSLGAAVFDDKIYAIGGSNVGWEFQPVATVEEYNPSSDTLIDSITSVYEYQYTPETNVDADGFAHYKIYIPDEIDTLKGVYCILPGGQQSSLDVVTNSDLKAYVEEKDFALMGAHQIGKYWDLPLWSAEALILALKELSLISNHNELEFSPLLFRGYSAGASFSYNFTQLEPERVIAFVSLRGTFYAPDTIAASDASRKVPGYLIGGENDEAHRIENMTNIFEKHRSLEALWATAIEPDTDHLGDFPTETMHSFFNEIIPMRLPEIFPTDTIPQLMEIDEETGWLGNRDTYEINSYTNYSGDKTKACWFPNDKIANEWKDLVTIISFRNHSLPEKSQLFQNYPNPFNPSTTIKFQIPNSKFTTLKVYNILGKEVSTLVSNKLNSGNHTYQFDGRNLASGVYYYKLVAEDFREVKKMILLR